ncbi:MAG: hypothetical protein NC924_03095 [Candidatus Omnitrophica bacterium]|nr:hypothetical protein [Candidatus Omnitrophota bacterium]
MYNKSVLISGHTVSQEKDLLKIIQDRSKGAMLFEDFLREKALSMRDSYALGITDRAGVYLALCQNLGLANWKTGYAEILQLIDWSSENSYLTNERMDRYLQAIQNKTVPAIFFVPPQLDTFYQDGVTRREMQWLMSHPALMRNVLFVFGAYEFFQEAIRNAPQIDAWDVMRQRLVRGIAATHSQEQDIYLLLIQNVLRHNERAQQARRNALRERFFSGHYKIIERAI